MDLNVTERYVKLVGNIKHLETNVYSIVNPAVLHRAGAASLTTP